MYQRILTGLNVGIVLAAMLVILSWFILTPSHDRAWQDAYARTPTIMERGTSTYLFDVRDFSYATTGEVIAKRWYDLVIDTTALSGTYFIVEPFYDHDAIAHTMLAFAFADGTPTIVASIEARREVGETYAPLRATLLPTYEYLLVWATERDMYANSTYVSRDELYRYPLRVPLPVQQTILRDFLAETAAIAAQPRWYNTLTANCTNELARIVRKRYRSSVPFDISWYLPGYSAPYLAKLGYIPTMSETDAHITPIVRSVYRPSGQSAAAFSELLQQQTMPPTSSNTAVADSPQNAPPSASTYLNTY